MKKEKCTWDKYTEEELKEVYALSGRYKKFLSECKTERECVKKSIEQAEKNGFKNLDELIKNNINLKPGDRVYANNYNKGLALFIIGDKPFETGLRILGAHIDAPRLDFKLNPLYEDSGFAMAKTHYYGGIKKYQWATIPLAIHGFIAKKDGTTIDISIGEKDDEPVLAISDLLVHLSKEQLDKTMRNGITAEDLNVCLGSIPLKDSEESNLVKANILKLLNEKYGMDEEDFASSEIQLVPAGPARDYGLDSSMIMGYGQDDRASAYTCLEAFMNVSKPDKTCALILTDKEEVGSRGATGMNSRFFENIAAEVMNLTGEYSELKLRRSLTNSKMLSCDVNPAYDPNYSSVMDKLNSAYMSKGLAFNMFVGSAGKVNTNHASAEYAAKLRGLMDKFNVSYQFAEFGKVDIGGGGTIAHILAEYNMDVIDCGIPVLSVHAPWEISSKADLYEALQANIAFLLNA